MSDEASQAAVGHWVMTSHGWRHRPPWKVTVNTALRALQPWSRRWVVYTRCVGDPPVAIGYGFGRIRHEGVRPLRHAAAVLSVGLVIALALLR